MGAGGRLIANNRPSGPSPAGEVRWGRAGASSQSNAFTLRPSPYPLPEYRARGLVLWHQPVAVAGRGPPPPSLPRRGKIRSARRFDAMRRLRPPLPALPRVPGRIRAIVSFGAPWESGYSVLTITPLLNGLLPPAELAKTRYSYVTLPMPVVSTNVVVFAATVATSFQTQPA